MPLFFSAHLQAPPLWRNRRRRSVRSEGRLDSKPARSGERRVGKKGRSRWWPDHLKKKKEKQVAQRKLQVPQHRTQNNTIRHSSYFATACPNHVSHSC